MDLFRVNPHLGKLMEWQSNWSFLFGCIDRAYFPFAGEGFYLFTLEGLGSNKERRLWAWKGFCPLKFQHVSSEKHLWHRIVRQLSNYLTHSFNIQQMFVEHLLCAQHCHRGSSFLTEGNQSKSLPPCTLQSPSLQIFLGWGENFMAYSLILPHSLMSWQICKRQSKIQLIKLSTPKHQI